LEPAGNGPPPPIGVDMIGVDMIGVDIGSGIRFLLRPQAGTPRGCFCVPAKVLIILRN
jgi:hypothetical protein